MARGASGTTEAAARPLTSPLLTSPRLASPPLSPHHRGAALRVGGPDARPRGPVGREASRPRARSLPNHGPSRCSHRLEPPPRDPSRPRCLCVPRRASSRPDPLRTPPEQLKKEASSRLLLLAHRRRRTLHGQWSCPMAEEGEGAGRGAGLEDPVPPHPPSPARTRSGLRAGPWDLSVIWLSAPIRELPDDAHPKPGTFPVPSCGEGYPTASSPCLCGPVQTPRPSTAHWPSTTWTPRRGRPLCASNTTGPKLTFLPDQLSLLPEPRNGPIICPETQARAWESSPRPLSYPNTVNFISHIFTYPIQTFASSYSTTLFQASHLLSAIPVLAWLWPSFL